MWTGRRDMIRKFVILFLHWAMLLYQKSDASRTNFKVKRFEVCNNTQGRIKFFGSITEENGNQYLSYNLTSPVPWDDNLGVTCLIETRVVGEIFTELFTVREKDICKACNKYLGELWYDIERASQIIPGLCPIREGRYHAHRALLDYHKMSLQTFPFGRLRFTIKAVDNKNPSVNMWCIMQEVENNID